MMKKKPSYLLSMLLAMLTLGAMPASAQRVVRGLVVDGEGTELPTATAIQTIQSDSRRADGSIYNLQGIRVAAPTKGLYIQNGRKIVLRNK